MIKINLKQLLLDKRLTQKELSEKADIGETTISAIKRRGKISMPHLRKIEKRLKAKLDKYILHEAT